MRDRGPIFLTLLLAGALVVVIVLVLRRGDKADDAALADAESDASSARAFEEPLVAEPIARPPGAVTELGVLTEHSKDDLAFLLDKRKVADLLKPEHCGDKPTCAAVRDYVLAEGHVRLDLRATNDWMMPSQADIPNATATMTREERDRIPALKQIFIVTAGGPRDKDQLAARAGFAIAAAVAQKLHGAVYDQVIGRIESAATFASHAITESLGRSVFRRDRIEVVFRAKAGESNIRLFTAGMVRFGAPDLELSEVSPTLARPLVDVLDAVADAVVAGAEMSPVDVRGVDGPIAVGVTKVMPENGDPNDVMARVIPPPSAGGANPHGYEELAAMILGEQALDDEEPSDEEMKATREKAQAALPALLAKRPQGMKLFLELPFAAGVGVPDPNKVEAGAPTEWMWIDVTSFDEDTVTGTLVDDPDNVPSLKQGAKIRRARADVSDYRLETATEAGAQ